MAVNTIIETTGETGSFEQGNKIRASRQWAVVVTSPLDTAKTVLVHPKIVKPYTEHPDYRGVYAISVTAEQDEDTPELWMVEAEYSSELEEEEEDKNPLARAAKISWTTNDFSRIVTTDRHGRPLTNTAGDLIEEVTLEDARWVIRVEKNIAKMPNWVLHYRNAVNSDTVRIENLTFPPDTLKIRRLNRSEIQNENKTDFFTLSFELHHRQEGWTARLLNRGWNEIESYQVNAGFLITKKRKVRALVNGEYPNSPVFLDKTGARPLDDDGDIKEPLEPSDIITRDYELEPRLPFRVLPLK